MLSQKDFNNAISTYDEAIELIPDNAAIYRERGRAKLLKGEKDESIKDMKKALELSPDSQKLTGEFRSFSNTER